MRTIFLRTALLFTLTSSSSSQFLPVSLSHRQPPGCQFPSATEGAYIYFNHPDDPHQYSIATPWTRFYPDALRADLAAQGFQLVTQASEYAHDACGWKTIDTVKKNGWLRGRVSYRHISSGKVKIPHASEKKFPSGTLIPLNPHANRTAAIETGRLVNHVRRNDSIDTFNTKPTLSFNIQTQGLNETFDDTSSATVSRDALPETVVDKHAGEDKPCDTYKFAVLQALHVIMQVPGVLTLITDDRIEELVNNARVADEKLAPLLSKVNSNDDDENKSCDTSQCALLKTLRGIFQIPGAVALLDPGDVRGAFEEAQTADESLVALIKDLPLPDNEYKEYGDPPYLRVYPYSGNLAYWDMVKKNVDKFFAEPPSTDPNELDLHLHIPEESIAGPASPPSPTSISPQESNHASNTMAEKHASPPAIHSPSTNLPTLLRRQDPSPSNETLSLIHKTLLANSPEADILYMLLEIGAPIIGVVAFFTFALLVTRRVADKLYPDPELASEQGDIELNTMRKSSSTHSDKTLVDNAPRVVPKAETSRSWCGPGKVRFWRPGAPFGGVQKMSLEKGEGGKSDGGNKWVGWEGKREVRPQVQVQVHVPLVPVQRQSSSVYSRSMDEVTLYPGRTVEG